MGNKMLIDAAHPEETRVVVLRGNRIEEFDFESASKKQLRGNIYLAKVTRVEPSLQAAFIEYGGNRHGFLAFSEIHPDYYQIPIADRQALLDDEAASADEDEDEPRPSNGGGKSEGGHGEKNGHRRSRRHRRGGQSAEKRAAPQGDAVTSEAIGNEQPGDEPALPGTSDEATAPLSSNDKTMSEGRGDHGDEVVAPSEEGRDAEGGHQHAAEIETVEPLTSQPADADAVEHHDTLAPSDASLEISEAAPAEREHADAPHEAEDGGEHESDAHDGHEDDVVEQLGGDALEEVPRRSSRPRRNYKIQEVIKRRQVLLVQVVKEERGNKGAALTTYLSLAGRYSVLMPNTARGGGISRKIVDPEDRKRLKAIAQELEVPDGMGIILRTAGASRSMPEVKRDFEYLMRMWETVRETTLSSSAPTLVYEEGSLIKRSIRDLFTKDVDEVVVSGDEAYREAKDFMRLLMPNQVRNVVAWREPQPIFAKSGAETQLDAMFSNQVTLKSGGYLVINQTEALVAIDVNSGRSTREHNIEDTALRTNLEAADEVARQLRLRDLAGLIVVDFIDMEESRNDRAVERRIKDALKNDRARIQIGRISHFGLLEMSRQRMRTGVVEGSTVMCPHCAGSGTVRSVSSMALHVLRLLEDTLIRSAAFNLIAKTRSEVAIYILNQKRANLLDLEARFGVAITVLSDPALMGMVYHAVERGSEATPPAFLPFRPATPVDATEEVEEEFEEVEETLASEPEDTMGEAGDAEPGETAANPDATRQNGEEGEAGRRRRRRRRRRGGRDQAGTAPEGGLEAAETVDAEGVEGEPDGAAFVAETGVDALSDIESGFLPEGTSPPAAEAEELTGSSEPEATVALSSETATASAKDEPAEAQADAPPAEAPRRRRAPRRSTRSVEAAEPTAVPETGDATAVAVASEPAASEEPAAPARRTRRPRAKAASLALDLDGAAAPAADREPGAAATQTGAASSSEPELPLLSTPAPVPAAKPAPSAKPEPKSADVALAAPEAETVEDQDPDRPKRSGWWQRAKATFTAGS